MEGTSEKKKKVWTDEERLELASKLDTELDEYISNLEKKSYTEGWPEDRWDEEMEKHPFFMKKAPEPGEKLSPLMEGLLQLKYGEDENTPEELANNYKEDGNFNFKHKKYRLAIVSYTEGIRTKCKDTNLMAQLYNNRAAAHYMLKNFRSSLNDCKLALKLTPKYIKVSKRAANCCFHVKNYEQCIDFCNEILKECPNNDMSLRLKSQAIAAGEQLKIEQRNQDKLEKKLDKGKEDLLTIIRSRGVNLELIEGKRIPVLKDLEPQTPQVAQSRVHLDAQNKLIWPVMILYPEMQQTDFIQNFHEDASLLEQLEQVFSVPPEWDSEERYTIENINVYFEGKDKCSLHKVNICQSLGKILQDKQYIVRGGTPTFLVLVNSSEAEKRFLANYSIHYL
ncbi:DNA polymerase interacting tetratricopeptide repeat-containing, protein of 47 kDa [Frieseomelitta varia]|nr:DNA polymerase interacting tetratricopeptide repeat-containing, protein of 47 kDa [Frieseomelitta varia]